jgi:hypothetical protein
MEGISTGPLIVGDFFSLQPMRKLCILAQKSVPEDCVLWSTNCCIQITNERERRHRGNGGLRSMEYKLS